MIIETHIVKNSLSKVSKKARVYTGTRWSATVSRYGVFDDVRWAVYSGQLVICSGDNFFFSDAVSSAIRCLNEKINDKWWDNA